MTIVTLPSHVSFTASTSFQNFYALFKPSEQDKKFTTILITLCALYFIIAVIVPFLDQVDVPRAIKEQVPVQLAKIVLKEKQLSLPEKVKEKLKELKAEKPEDTPEDKPKEVKVEKSIENIQKQPILSIEKRRELAKQKAQKSGLAAMKDEFFAMREAFDIAPATNTTLSTEKASEVKVKRKLLSSEVNKQSTALAAKQASNVIKSDALTTRNTQQIRLSDEEVLADTDVLVKDGIAEAKSGERSEMSLRRTLEAHKARLYARYNSALRKDPFLQGKVLFELEIQPNGKISNITIKSSELNNAKLERQLLVILRGITFPAAGVGVMNTIWAIDFLPS